MISSVNFIFSGKWLYARSPQPGLLDLFLYPPELHPDVRNVEATEYRSLGV